MVMRLRSCRRSAEDYRFWIYDLRFWIKESDTMDNPKSEIQNPKSFAITNQPLDPAPLVALVQSPDMGALVTFAGIVRNNFGGRATAYLEYEAYESMALTVLGQLAGEARATWGTGAIAIHHRV